MVPVAHPAEPSPAGVPGALTDPAAVAVEDLTFPGFGGTPVKACLARPAAPGACPGLIVIQTAAGLGGHLRDVTARLANRGYVAIAPDLYTREGGPPAQDPEAIMKRLFAMPDETVLGDLRGALDLLLARGDTTGKAGCIGFCMGGRATLMLACVDGRLAAAVDCWGGFIDRATPEERSTPARPTPPLDMVGGLNCPLMAAFGDEDDNPSPAVAQQLRERLQAVPRETVIDFYEGAGHAFFADDRPTYRPGPAARLWERVIPFLATHLQEP